MIRGLKLLSSLLLIGIIALFIKQNLPTFSMELPFYLDLHIREKLMWYHTVGGVIFLSIVLGFILGFMMGFRLYWRKRKEYNKLKQAEGSLPQEANIEDRVSDSAVRGESYVE